MRKWKWSFFVTFALLITTNGFWFFSAIDAEVTYTYQKVSLDDKSKAIKMLGNLIVKGGQKYTKQEILHLIHQANKEAFIVDEENIINVERVQFMFKGDKLSEIRG
jgi:hypothetical protein